MSTYPTSPRNAFLDWCQVHEPVFTQNARAIGLTEAQATAFRTRMEAARDYLLRLEQIRQQAKVATEDTLQAFGLLQASAGDAVRSIRAFAETAAEPAGVYSLAQVPPPSQPTPMPPPAQPTDLRVTLGASDGTITLRWKAANPTGTSGTCYIVRRKLPTETEFQFLGVSGNKMFVDDTLVLGGEVREGILAPGILAPAVQYTVQGQRGSLTGPVSPIFTVNFGKLPNGRQTVASVSAASGGAGGWNVEIPAAASNGNTKRRPARV